MRSVSASFEGLVVVRRLKYVDFGYTLETEKVSKLHYCGLDRSPWDNARSAKALSRLPVENALCVKGVMESANCSILGIPLLKTLDDAITISDIFKDNRDEIIAVADRSCQKLSIGLDLFRWIGFDVFSIGEWSLIKEGIFRITVTRP